MATGRKNCVCSNSPPTPDAACASHIISARNFKSSIYLCDLTSSLAFPPPGSTSKGGVRFPDDDEDAPIDNSCDEKAQDKIITAIPEPDGAYLVKAGFLRSHHKYEIVFSLPQVPTMGKDVTLSPALRTTARPRLRATRITPRPEGGVKVVCEYSAQQEGVVQEDLTLVNRSRRDSSVKVRLQARVMERHHGTPMLLDGVHCIGEEKQAASKNNDTKKM